MKESAFAIFAAATTCCIVAEGLPKAMFLNIVSLKRIASCVTIPILSLKEDIDNCLMFVSSKKISPELTSAKREIKSSSVDFPAPDSPTKATTCPFFIVRFMSFNTFSELFS